MRFLGQWIFSHFEVGNINYWYRYLFSCFLSIENFAFMLGARRISFCVWRKPLFNQILEKQKHTLFAHQMKEKQTTLPAFLLCRWLLGTQYYLPSTHALTQQVIKNVIRKLLKLLFPEKKKKRKKKACQQESSVLSFEDISALPSCLNISIC